MSDERNDQFRQPQDGYNTQPEQPTQPNQPAQPGQYGAGQHQTGQQYQSGQGAGQAQRRSYTEEFRVSGESVLAKIKELVHEGNVRRITIKNDDGRTLIEIPLTLGVIGTVLLPVWAAIGAIAAMAANLTIAVERTEGVPGTDEVTPRADTDTPPAP